MVVLFLSTMFHIFVGFFASVSVDDRTAVRFPKCCCSLQVTFETKESRDDKTNKGWQDETNMFRCRFSRRWWREIMARHESMTCEAEKKIARKGYGYKLWQKAIWLLRVSDLVLNRLSSFETRWRTRSWEEQALSDKEMRFFERNLQLRRINHQLQQRLHWEEREPSIHWRQARRWSKHTQRWRRCPRRRGCNFGYWSHEDSRHREWDWGWERRRWWESRQNSRSVVNLFQNRDSRQYIQR